MKIEQIEDDSLLSNSTIIHNIIFKKDFSPSLYDNNRSGYESQQAIIKNRNKYNSAGYDTVPPAKGLMRKRKREVLESEKPQGIRFEEQENDGDDDDDDDADNDDDHYYQQLGSEPPRKRSKRNKNNKDKDKNEQSSRKGREVFQ